MITREELYELVWATPMTKAATQFEVSGSYLARVCEMLSVPRPERGYWAKLAVGRAPAIPPLPEARPGDPIEWSKEGAPLFSAPQQRMATRPKTEVQKAQPVERTRRVPRAKPAVGAHGLIQGARGHFEAGRKVEEREHLRPFKKSLVDVTASAAGLLPALAFANDIFNALEARGCRVSLAAHGTSFRRCEVDDRETSAKQLSYDQTRLWKPGRATLVHIDQMAIGLSVVEMTEPVEMRYLNGKYIPNASYAPPKRGRVDHSWTTTMNLPSGRLRLVAYSPFWRVSWTKTWQEGKTGELTKRIPAIVSEIVASAPGLLEKVEAADREAEVQRRAWKDEQERRRREEIAKRIEQSKADSRAQLDQIIRDWSRTIDIRRFLDGVRERIDDMPADRREEAVRRLVLARSFLGTTDPMDSLLSWRTPAELYVPEAEAGDEG